MDKIEQMAKIGGQTENRDNLQEIVLKYVSN